MIVLPGSKLHICAKFTQIGVWEGVDSADQPTNGPIIECDECEVKSRILWEKWERMPQDRKSVKIREKGNLFS